MSLNSLIDEKLLLAKSVCLDVFFEKHPLFRVCSSSARITNTILIILQDFPLVHIANYTLLMTYM